MENSKEEKQRTLQQNRAMHLYFTKLSEALNEAGLDMREVLKPSIDIPWTPKNAKDYLWKPIEGALLHKHSTTQLTTKEIDKVYDILNRHTSEKFGISILFPSIEEVIFSKPQNATYLPNIPQE